MSSDSQYGAVYVPRGADARTQSPGISGRPFASADIAGEVGIPIRTVNAFCENAQKPDGIGKLRKSANHEDVDFIGDGTDKNRGDRQVYSIWNFAKATNEVRHFGPAAGSSVLACGDLPGLVDANVDPYRLRGCKVLHVGSVMLIAFQSAPRQCPTE